MNLRNLTFSLLSLCLAAAPSAVAHAQNGVTPPVGNPGVDSDGDSINDAVDAEPCDDTVSARGYEPADRTWGMLLFEDQWPNRGDFDFNDLVLAYNETLEYAPNAELVGIRMDLRVMAVGAKFQNGLAVRFPGLSKTDVSFLSLTIGGVGQPVATRSNDADAVVTLANDLHALFGESQNRNWVNTDPNAPQHAYVDIVVEVRLSSGHGLSAANAPFDIFIYNTQRGTEVHRPAFRGTAGLNGALVNTRDDATTAQRAFVTSNGIPFVLEIPETALYPSEGTPIELLFPEILAFGASAGQNATTFYRNPAAGQAFGNTSPGSLVAAATVDVACFAPQAGVCGTDAGTGHVNAPTMNLCEFGSESTVSSAGSLFRWDCTGVYSAPTACTAPDLVCAPNTTSDCSNQINNGSGIMTCNGSGSGFGTCALTSCNTGFYQSGSTCAAQVCTPGLARSCTVSGGTGTETCDSLGSQWGACTVVSCNSGFVRNGNTCQAGSGDDVYYKCTGTSGYVAFVDNIDNRPITSLADQLNACLHYGFLGLSSSNTSQWGRGSGPVVWSSTNQLQRAVNCHNCFNSDGGNAWYYSKGASGDDCTWVAGDGTGTRDQIVSAYIFNVDDSNLSCMTFKNDLGPGAVFGDNDSSESNDVFYHADYNNNRDEPNCERRRDALGSYSKHAVLYQGTPDYILCGSPTIQ